MLTMMRFIFALWLLLTNVKLGAVYRLKLCYYYTVILKCYVNKESNIIEKGKKRREVKFTQ